MEIRNLSKVSLSDLTTTFNEAFSDYMVPVQVTEEQMYRKIKTAKFDMNLSAGAFVEDQLVGFILHGEGNQNGKTVLWNGGTGVIPTQRGKGLTEQMYQHIIPVLKDRGFQRVILEVIIGNDPAIHVYKKTGFEIIRNLGYFKATDKITKVSQDVALRSINKPFDWSIMEEMRSWEPSYQNHNQRMDLLGDVISGIGAFAGEEMVGYILFDQDPELGDVFQFAVEESYRRRGIGRALFSKVASSKNVPLKTVNVDARHTESIAFFKSLGFESPLGQHEMQLNL